MATGNGVDLGAVVAMLTDLQMQMRQGFAESRAEFGAMRVEIAQMRAEFEPLKADSNTLRSEFDLLRDDSHHQIAGLRETVDFYHQSVVGNGITLSQVEDRLTRLEAPPAGPPAAA